MGMDTSGILSTARGGLIGGGRMGNLGAALMAAAEAPRPHAVDLDARYVIVASAQGARVETPRVTRMGKIVEVSPSERVLAVETNKRRALKIAREAQS